MTQDSKRVLEMTDTDILTTDVSTTETTQDITIRPGRPTKYTSELCDQVLKLGEKGFNKIEISGALKVNRKTLDRWANEHAEFKDALETALDWSHANFSLQLKSGMLGQIKGFNSGAAALIARNQYGWNDGNTNNTINIQNMAYVAVENSSTEELLKKIEAFSQKQTEALEAPKEDVIDVTVIDEERD